MHMGLASHVLENAKALNLLKNSGLAFPMHAILRCIFESSFKIAYLSEDDFNTLIRHKEFESSSIIDENKQINAFNQSIMINKSNNKIIEKYNSIYYQSNTKEKNSKNIVTIGFVHESVTSKTVQLPSIENIIKLVMKNDINLAKFYYDIYYRECSAQSHARFFALRDYLKNHHRSKNESEEIQLVRDFLGSANDFINMTNAALLKIYL
jgi:Family of unknown function (DUF5677)